MKILFTTITLLMLVACNNSNSKQISDAELERRAEEAAEEAIKKAEADLMKEQFSWSYETEKDEMSDKLNRFASITSPDVAEFDFPYDGGQYLTLTVREMDGSEDVLIRISDGQFHTKYGDEYVLIKFDGNNPVKYSVSEPSDGSSDLLFINNDQDFISKLKKAKTLKIEAQFYNNGSRVFSFNVKGFKW